MSERAENPDRFPSEVLNRGGWANGDVYLMHAPQGKIVVKTYADKPPLIRWLGAILLRREQRAYEALEGVAGIPSLVDIGEPDVLAMEYVAGERISNRLLSRHGQSIVTQLTELIHAMHERGVYHLDLRNQGNILIDERLRPTVLDFASAMVVHRRGPLSRLLAALCRRFDLYGLSKWRNRSEELRQDADA